MLRIGRYNSTLGNRTKSRIIRSRYACRSLCLFRTLAFIQKLDSHNFLSLFLYFAVFMIAQNFLKQFEESIEMLGKYIDLYQIHSATFESGVLENEDVHKALHKCREENGIAIGLSVSSPKQDEVIQKAMTLEVDGTKLFDSVQCTFNLLEQRPGTILQKAHEAGMDIIIKEGMANGRVLQNPVVQEYSKKLSCAPDQLALACILAQPFQPRVLSGAVTTEQLDSNLEAEAIAERLRSDPAVLTEIMEKTKMESEVYWSDRSALAWN